MSSCSGVVVGEDGVNWDELKDCEPLPLSIILLLFISACWGFFFIVTGIRRLKHSLSATRDTVVVKKLQHVQIWFYSYFYNLTYITSIFALISYVLDSYFIASGCIVLGVLISTAINSEIDVVGDVSRKPGVNEVSGTIAFEYLITSYLPKAVWKASGHREFEKKTSSDTALSKKTSFSKALSNIFLCGNSDNHITPKVYDVKDVAGIQGAFLGLPALFVYFLTLIRSTSEGEEFLVGNVTQFSDVYSILEMNVMIKVAASMALLSALLPPMLGDWELFARDMGLGAGKTILYTGLSVSKRLIELTGRVGFYLYFVDTTKFGGLILFTVELFLMFATYINTRDSPSGGRTYTNSHYLLTAVESTFFGFYRRISVDKEFVTHGVQMSPTIELIRYIIKGVATSAGYLMLLGFDFPDTYVEFKHGVDMLPAMFFVGLGANVLLALETIIEFVGFRRKQLDRKELGRLTTYWKSWWLCSKVLCPSTVVHVNRDDNMGTINYV